MIEARRRIERVKTEDIILRAESSPAGPDPKTIFRPTSEVDSVKSYLS